MQHQGDRPVRGGRPSLLSPEEQAVPERQGILSSLDGMPGQAAVAKAPQARPRARRLAWGGAAVGAIAVCGALFFAGGGDEHRAPAVAAGPTSAPALTTVADAGNVAPAAPVTPVSLPAPPAPAPAVLRDEPAGPVEPMANPLADMAVPAAPAHRKEPAKAEKAEKVEHRAAHHKGREPAQERTREKSREAAKDKKAKTGAAKEPDSDVVLLAALMSHMEPKRAKATPAEQLESCRRYNAAGEEQCRARVCESTGRKEAACRRVKAARADPET